MGRREADADRGIVYVGKYRGVEMGKIVIEVWKRGVTEREKENGGRCSVKGREWDRKR